MGHVLPNLFVICSVLLLLDPAFSLPLCSDSTAPLTLNISLKFCPYNGSVSCNSTTDSQIQKQFQAMDISDTACASLIKSILCARCDQFSADLYSIASTPRSVPVLCNSTVSANSSQSNQAKNNFCSEVWDTCQNVPIQNSPFSNPQTAVPGNSSTLSELWPSKNTFCNAFGGASTNESVCFDGEPVSLNITEIPIPPHGMCMEKIGNGSFLNMIPHPDGSNRAFFTNQEGKVWLGTIPEQGSGKNLELNETSPFVDLTDVVDYDSVFGLMGFAFHPNFTENGRFFASFNCDKVKWAGCTGRCSCNSDNNCDPSKLPFDNGIPPCQKQSVVVEYTVSSSASRPSLATYAMAVEVRRILTIGLPFSAHHGGQILFGPDGYLYFMMGDGGGGGDPYNFAQNKKSLLGKIWRLDVDNVSSQDDIDKLGLWGNYTIPKDNPYIDDQELLPEIWALGLCNPWRCSFDPERPSYFMCGDVGQDHYEEVDIITRGGNYGWRVYEGPTLYNPPTAPANSTPPNSINPIFPVMGYNHSEVNNNIGSASITGGYFYRSQTDPCMNGWYMFGDLYAATFWAGTENPENSGNFTTSQVNFNCAHDSPLPCTFTSKSSYPALGYLFSFGQDNNKDIYALTSSGVYRVVAPSRCNFTCSEESINPAPPPTSSPGSNAAYELQSNTPLWNNLLVLLSSLLFLLFSSG